MLFLSAGLCAGIISAISVALFPTNYRAMATCLILMFGRIGAVGGSNFVGLLLDVNCDLIFYLYSALILSKLLALPMSHGQFCWARILTFAIAGCVVVCFFLNTNPQVQATVGPAASAPTDAKEET